MTPAHRPVSRLATCYSSAHPCRNMRAHHEEIAAVSKVDQIIARSTNTIASTTDAPEHDRIDNGLPAVTGSGSVQPAQNPLFAAGRTGSRQPLPARAVHDPSRPTPNQPKEARA